MRLVMKVGTPHSFKSLAEAMKNPGTPFVDMTGTDMVNFGMELQARQRQPERGQSMK